MDDSDVISRGILRVVGGFLARFLLEFFFYYIGWPIVKIVTLGHYPNGKKKDGWKVDTSEGNVTASIGVLAFAIAGMGFFHYAGYL